jgi:hypothetical protein
MIARNSIGGQLDYHALANLHKPTDATRIAKEVRRLHAQGLTDRDISATLHLGLAAVTELLKAQAKRKAVLLPNGRIVLAKDRVVERGNCR